MNRQNKKESVADLHRERILSAAEKLFLEKGVKATTIDDICRLSDYSRRTIYAYYAGKEDILGHIVRNGLMRLEQNLQIIVDGEAGFVDKFFAICDAMADYQRNFPQSAESVNTMQTAHTDMASQPPVFFQIMEAGNAINRLLFHYLEDGKQSNAVRKEIETEKSVYILWSSVTSLLSLVANKGSFLEERFQTSAEEFLHYGYKQIINSILEFRIE